MAVKGDVTCLRAHRRPALFGAPELDNILADGGVTAGSIHLIEPLRREGVCGVGADVARRDQRVAACFARGFLARSGRPSVWIGPPPDLLCDANEAAGPAPHIELAWTARDHVDVTALTRDGVLAAALDARRALRLAAPLRMTRQMQRRGVVPVVLVQDAAAFVSRLGASAVHWRVGCDDPAGAAVDAPETWRIELLLEDRVRRVLTTPCDAGGRLASAPRPAVAGKELMRRLARAV